MTGTPRRFTVMARTDTLLAMVHPKQLNGLLKAHPEWWRHLVVGITEYADIAAMSNVSRARRLGVRSGFRNQRFGCTVTGIRTSLRRMNQGVNGGL